MAETRDSRPMQFRGGKLSAEWKDHQIAPLNSLFYVY
jgi:hypothetical protein